MSNLYEIGTVVELPRENRKDILRYNGHHFFEHRFLNLTPGSNEFGLPTLLSEDSEYGEWAQGAAKKIGKLNSAETEVILAHPEKAGKLMEIILGK